MQSHLLEVIKTVAQIIYGMTHRRVSYRIYQVQRNTTELQLSCQYQRSSLLNFSSAIGTGDTTKTDEFSEMFQTGGHTSYLFIMVHRHIIGACKKYTKSALICDKMA